MTVPQDVNMALPFFCFSHELLDARVEVSSHAADALPLVVHVECHSRSEIHIERAQILQQLCGEAF